MAKLFFRYGAMNSGKTALLLQAAHNYEEQDMKVIIMKPNIDTKGEKKIVSRIGLSREVEELLDEKTNIYKLVEQKYRHINCIFIDEAQFLKRQQVDELLKIVIDFNIPVICYGLRSDFLTNGFEGSIRLLEIAHKIEEMKTICKCGKKAMFNLRKIDGKVVFDGNKIEIDNQKNVSYEAVCPNCYYKYKNSCKTPEKSI